MEMEVKVGLMKIVDSMLLGYCPRHTHRQPTWAWALGVQPSALTFTCAWTRGARAIHPPSLVDVSE